MTSRTTAHLALVLVTASALSACQFMPGQKAEPSTASAEVTDQSTDQKAAEATDSGKLEIGSVVDLAGKELIDRHPNGVSFEIKSIKIMETGFVVNVHALNGDDAKNQLVRGGAWLIDDTGVVYKFRKPEGNNPDLSLQPGESMTGDWVFLGKPVPSAKSLTLKTNTFGPNKNVDLSTRSEFTSMPQIVVSNIPLKANP